MTVSTLAQGEEAKLLFAEDQAQIQACGNSKMDIKLLDNPKYKLPDEMG